MAGLDGPARKLKTLLGRDGFVRRDRKGRALFVSDYPARLLPDRQRALAARLRSAGFRAVHEDGLALIDWTYARCLDFLTGLSQKAGAGKSESEDGLVRIFERHPLSFTEEMLGDARAALLLWDRGAHERLRRLAGEALAKALRQRAPIPLYYPLLLREMNDRHKEEPLC